MPIITPIGRPAICARERQALGARLVHGLDQPPPALRVRVAVGEQEPDRAAGFLGELPHPAQLEFLVVEVAVHAERAGAGDAQRRADAQQLMVVGVARRHQLAVRRLVRIGARRGEAERAAAQRLDGQAAHLGDVVRRRRLAAHGAVAHDIDAQRQMRDLRGDVDRARPAFQLVHVFGEALPLPVQAGGQHGIGNLLDAFHQIHQRLAVMLLHRREADAAIAEHHRRDAVPARRRQQRIPHRLSVIMRVHVDPAGRDQQAVGVDVAPGRALLAAHGGDAAVGDRNVAREGCLAGAIDDGAAANDDVVHGSRSGCDPAMMHPGR